MPLRVLVTGASSGIGAASARAFAARGAALVVTGRDVDRLQAVADEVSATPIAAVLPDDAEEVAAAAESTLGGIDVLVNAAGVPRRVHAARLRAADVEETVAVNYVGAARLTLALLPGMLARRRGDIVNVGSVAGRVPAPREAAYSAAKHALAAFTEVLAIDLAGSGVRAHLVTPGAIDTPLWRRPGQERAPVSGPRIPAETVADAIVGLVGTSRFEVFVPTRYRPVPVLRTLFGRAYLAATARFDRARAPDAHRLTRR